MQYGIYSNTTKKWLSDKMVKRHGKLYAVCGLTYQQSWVDDKRSPFLDLDEAQKQVKLLPKNETYQVVSAIGQPEIA